MDQDYKSILVPVDGSKEAEMAFRKAVKVAQLNKGHLDVLTVLDTKQFIGLHGGMLNGDVIYQLSEDAQKYLNELKDEAVKNGFSKDDIQIHVRFGEPKTVIATEFVEEYKNDLIMIGSTGMNAVTRLLVGSVSEYVTRNARTDVIIVRTDVDNNKIKGSK
ncbi:universal stress protein [Companilactobacillus mishanensis]|uniref:Universal stress protein n=1 Tax=Companilactobacillus mishanensis TaxID=2486008 RepID=A0A5P0ZJN6_9LACO|nr:universal stress protein [Companilactobacillus mishanensis]MQS45294.1 universal stress protein [Companilactobacillus mishanensis]MQS53284.1 universal stress protein [Companilactobacillus mishanensis]MQS90032.1 universal stress protein [Companilactobacillus mishanensis]